MLRVTPIRRFLHQLIRSVLILSVLSISRVHAADKVDLIIDTDPGADDVVALLLALASPEQLNVRAITTVAGNVRLDKTSRNDDLHASGRGVRTFRYMRGLPNLWYVRPSMPITFMVRKV